MSAGKVRFRPVMMTALAFVFGVMPMLFATGPGAGSRKALGAAVVFCMAMNAFIGTLFVPTFWVVMQRLSERLRRSKPQTRAASADETQATSPDDSRRLPDGSHPSPQGNPAPDQAGPSPSDKV